MKYLTINLGENKIELFNSWIGKETIKVNGNIVSKKFSITGTEHVFKIIENEKDVDCNLITGFGLYGVVIDLYKNGIPIIESPKIGCWAFILIVMALLCLIDLITGALKGWYDYPI